MDPRVPAGLALSLGGVKVQSGSPVHSSSELMCLLPWVPREIPARSTPFTFPPHTRVFSVTKYLFAEHWQVTAMLSVDSEAPPSHCGSSVGMG